MDQSFLPNIWAPSACTMPYVNKAPAIQRSRRFQFNSIYYKDDPFKQKIQQDPLSRPQIILSQFRKKVKEATKSYHTMSHLTKKKKGGDKDISNFDTLNVKVSQITGRLYESPQKIVQLKYDVNGNRSSYFQNKNQKQNRSNERSISPKQFKLQKIQAKDSDNVYITSTLRTDLGRPLNFNPGPGSYHYRLDQDKVGLFYNQRMSNSSLSSSIEKDKVSNLRTIDKAELMNDKRKEMTNDRRREMINDRRKDMFGIRDQRNPNQNKI